MSLAPALEQNMEQWSEKARNNLYAISAIASAVVDFCNHLRLDSHLFSVDAANSTFESLRSGAPVDMILHLIRKLMENLCEANSALTLDAFHNQNHINAVLAEEVFNRLTWKERNALRAYAIWCSNVSTTTPATTTSTSTLPSPSRTPGSTAVPHPLPSGWLPHRRMQKPVNPPTYP